MQLIISFAKKKKSRPKPGFCSDPRVFTPGLGYVHLEKGVHGFLHTNDTIWLPSCLPIGHALFLSIHPKWAPFPSFPKAECGVSGGFPPGVHKFSYTIHSLSFVDSLSLSLYLKLTLIITSEFSTASLLPHFKVWEQEEQLLPSWILGRQKFSPEPSIPLPLDPETAYLRRSN